MAGRKTSIYLPEDVDARVRASGVPLPELVRRGLDAGEPPPLVEMIRRVVREEMAAARQPGSACQHPSGAVEAGTCRACGSEVW